MLNTITQQYIEGKIDLDTLNDWWNEGKISRDTYVNVRTAKSLVEGYKGDALSFLMSL